MAKDSTTSARELLHAEGRDSSPRLSDWLIKDLKSARHSEIPPPAPLESNVVASAAAALPLAEPIAPPADAIEGESVPSDGSAQASPEEPRPEDEVFESEDLSDSLSYARAPEDTDDPGESSTATVGLSGHGVYASSSDWLDDDEGETTGGFFSALPDIDEPIGDAASADEDGGTSLSPQVLTPEAEEDDDAAGAFLIPGASGGSSRWKAVAAIAAAVLLLFLVVHQWRTSARSTATAANPVATALPTGPATANESPAPLASSEEETALGDTKSARGLGSGLGRSHGTPPDPPSDRAVPGGPSVARFPDLPRELLNQLEQAFESDEAQHQKSSTDAVDRYTR